MVGAGHDGEEELIVDEDDGFVALDDWSQICFEVGEVKGHFAFEGRDDEGVKFALRNVSGVHPQKCNFLMLRLFLIFFVILKKSFSRRYYLILVDSP